jgi:hypothetical protein
MFEGRLRPSQEKILGLNGARVYGVDVKARMNGIPIDYQTYSSPNRALKYTAKFKSPLMR